MGAALAVACADGGPPAGAAGSGWPATLGDPETLGRHVARYDAMMLEMDHRYAELYFAARERDWPYAYYQVVKLRELMDLALERRPEETVSAQNFFYPAMENIDLAVQRGDSASFAQAFYELRMSCNGCHTVENVPMISVGYPQERRSTISNR